MTEWSHTSPAQRIHFGPGSVDRVDEVIREVGGRRVLLVTTNGRLESPAGERLVAKLGRTLAATFDGVRSHVPTTAVQAALGIARDRDVDVVLSFGGGSCADLGKAVCFFVEHESGAPGASYLDRPGLPHVSIPTTYSGAELTAHFGVTEVSTRRKTGAGGPTIAPLAVIYDPVLTVDTPRDVSVQTGMNALAHGVEAAYSAARTPEAEALAIAAIRTITQALPLVSDDPTDLDARTAMLQGAILAGRCLQNSVMGAHHGLAQLLGGRTGMPHGLANALLLAHVVRYNAESVGASITAIGEALGDPGDASGAIDRLRARVGIPGGLERAGVVEEDLEAVARMSEGNSSVRSNPRPVSEADAMGILEAAYPDLD